MNSICKRKLEAIIAAHCVNRFKSVGDFPLEEAAYLCKETNLDFCECISCLYQLYSSTSADLMAKTAVRVWYGIVNKQLLTDALKGCKTEEETRAYTDTEVYAAVKDNLSLETLAYYEAKDNYQGVLSLSKGDLTTLKASERADILVVSALPNDYALVAGSMISALNKKGLLVNQESTKKEANYVRDLDCWISQRLPVIQGLEYDRILVFEPANPRYYAAKKLNNIFKSIKQFMPEAKNVRVTMPLICTQSGGADKQDILTAIFNAAKDNLTDQSNFLCHVNLCLFNTDYNTLTQKFEQLKKES